jgi:hypothetical protein
MSSACEGKLTACERIGIHGENIMVGGFGMGIRIRLNKI